MLDLHTNSSDADVTRAQRRDDHMRSGESRTSHERIIQWAPERTRDENKTDTRHTHTWLVGWKNNTRGVISTHIIWICNPWSEICDTRHRKYVLICFVPGTAEATAAAAAAGSLHAMMYFMWNERHSNNVTRFARAPQTHIWKTAGHMQGIWRAFGAFTKIARLCVVQYENVSNW